MPGVSRAQKAEAKYNVVLDFPDYGLHSAALSGNLGLVKYALDHRQPVNSALDSVLPLHAACAGGDDLVVRLLIDHGADVNAQRIPRRYSNDRHRSAVAPLAIPGASGSTPLHFAAAQGHSNVVLTLLLHGAHPDRPDKHGVTPEMLARQNRFTACADVLREWCHNKDRDLREREALGSYYPEDQTYRERETHNYCGSLDCRECATRKRIRMKRSIDSAIHILRHSSSHSSNLATPPHSAGQLPSNEPPSPSERPFGEYTPYHNADPTLVEELPPRRPSLPQVLEAPHHPTTPTSHRSRRPSNFSTSSSHRPRSAGNDAEPGPSAAPKVKGKISLLNIFKKGIETPDSVSSCNSSSSAVTSASTSLTGQPSALAVTSLASRSAEMLALMSETPAAGQSSTLHQRLFGDGAVPSPSSTKELQHAASRESLHGQVSAQATEVVVKGQSPVRPGILRAHGRSSSGQSASQPEGSGARSASGTHGSVRSLRFDAPGIPNRRSESHPHAQHTHAHTHAHHPSLDNRIPSSQGRSPATSAFGLRLEDEPDALTTSPLPIHPERCQTGNIEEEDEEALEEEEDEYGEPVQPQVGVADLKTRLSELHLKECSLLTSSTAAPEPDQSHRPHRIFECPFSINRRPPEATARLPNATPDTRGRGDSLSSMVTDTSNDPQSSYMATPALEQFSLPAPTIASPTLVLTDLPPIIDITTPEKKPRKSLEDVDTPVTGRRARSVALDIDIRNISSHAQAEALVQRAQQRIFDEEGIEEEERRSLGLTDDHTPLSARLAAYGESLLIERKFKEAEKRRSVISQSSSSEGGSTVNVHSAFEGERRGQSVLVRQLNLQEKGGAHSAARLYDPPLSSAKTEDELPRSSYGMSAPDSGDAFLSTERMQSNLLSISNPEHTGRLHGAASSSTSLISSPAAHAKTRSETLPLTRSLLQRSRTPDPEARLSSFGVPLARFPTCPTEDSLNELVPHKSSSQARQAARAQKLAKMGFSSTGDTWRESPGYSRSQKHRFGGFKTLVQNLTGRT